MLRVVLSYAFFYKDEKILMVNNISKIIRVRECVTSCLLVNMMY
jgi:hypothetical protein